MILPQTNEYWHLHKWIRNNYGDADHCSDPECEGKSQNFQWALNSDCEYEYKVENFSQLCVSCHRKQDGNGMGGKRHTAASKKKISESQSGTKAYWYGKKMSEETKAKMRAGHARRKLEKENSHGQ